METKIILNLHPFCKKLHQFQSKFANHIKEFLGFNSKLIGHIWNFCIFAWIFGI